MGSFSSTAVRCPPPPSLPKAPWSFQHERRKKTPRTRREFKSDLNSCDRNVTGKNAKKKYYTKYSSELHELELNK